MILRYLGHAFFTLELENGKTIAFDPYGQLYTYPERHVKCDLCLISHHHFDHDGMSVIDGNPPVIDKPGFYRPMDGVSILGVGTKHDEEGGRLRGDNTIFIVEAENLRIAHAGDLGHLLSAEQIREIGQVDVLMLPVGGVYTVDAAKAEQVRAQLNPTVTIPMHYKSEYSSETEFAPLADYLKITGAKDEALPLLRIAAADVAERSQIVALAIEK